MTRSIIDIHVLQTVPPSNLNRDDTGSPKTAVYGGTRRSRVSSQAWKQAVRRSFKDTVDASDLGERTKRVVESLAKRIYDGKGEPDKRALMLASDTLKAAGIKLAAPKKGETEESGYLLFLSNRQLDNLARETREAVARKEKVAARRAKEIASQDHSIDIAMFGRMVADASDINVDAACQVAHAISVHGVENEFDYFTAMDDLKEDDKEAGAAMIGTVEFNSATLYRYATIDVDRLNENLGNIEATKRAVAAFIRCFITSMPSGKQNSFANRTLPDAVLVRLRETQPINLVGAFEKAVPATDPAGRIEAACEAIAQHTTDVENTFDESPVDAWLLRVGNRTEALAGLGRECGLNELVSSVGTTAAQRLEQNR